MTRVRAALLGVLLSLPFPVLAACPPAGGSVPAGANTTDPAAPFYIDTAGLDLSTSPPTRDPSSPGYPRARALPDGQLPPAGAEGNFVIGPTHAAAPETVARADVPHGTVHTLTLSSADSVIYQPGVIRDDRDGCHNAAINTASSAPGDRSDLLVPASHAGRWVRQVDVYVPAQYVAGSEAPFLVFGDGSKAGFVNEAMVFAVLDSLIQAHRLPPMVAIGIGAGGQDAQGSERGREYDEVSGRYAEWVEHEVLPRVEAEAHVRLTKDPDGRAAMGFSSSAAAAFSMAWFHPNLYHRVLGYSPTLVNQQWPHDPALPGGAWEFHSPWAGAAAAGKAPETPGPGAPGLGAPGLAAAGPDGVPLVAGAARKPIRYWFEAGDRDLFYYVGGLADGMHDWVLANEDMARVLAAKGYHYQFVFARNAGHVDPATEAQTLPAALEWIWKDYPAPVQ